MLYFIQVMLYTAAMFAVYLLFLRNRTHYQLARYYLLLTAVLPFILPLLRLPAGVQARVGQLPVVSLPEISIGTFTKTTAAEINYTAIAAIVYTLIATCLVVRCLWQIISIRRMIHKHPMVKDGEAFIIHGAGYGPGSFGRYIFFPGTEVNELVLQHERAHVRLHHTRDVLLMALLQAVAWPNLLLVLVRKELAVVHEFQADEIPAADRNTYMELLVAAAFNTHNIPLAHSFIIHPIKRRIMMLQKNKTTSLLKPILQVSASLLVMVPAIMAFQSCNKQEKKSSGMEAGVAGVPVKGDLTYKTGKGNDTTVAFSFFETVDVQPEFPGGTRALVDFLAKTIKYPETARKNNIQGKVLVKFAVSDKGEILDPEVVRSPDPSLSAAALDAVKQMPAWKPGIKDGEAVCVAYTLPVSFRLDN